MSKDEAIRAAVEAPDLDHLESLARGATQGTEGEGWYVLDGRRVSATEPCEPVEQCGYNSACVALTFGNKQVANAAYIAACSPEVILRLCAIARAAEARECCNGDCGWVGQTDRYCGAVGPLCPDCGEVTELVSTARGCNPEKAGHNAGATPNASARPADGILQTAIEEALASLECGMVAGAIITLQDALRAALGKEAEHG
jgi:hypothetical protein